MSKIIYIFLISIILLGCSTQGLEIENNSNFKVTATSNGQKVSASDNSLIQRVEFTKSEMNGIVSLIKDDQIFGISTEKDFKGHVSGIKILTIKERSIAKKLSLERGDIIVSAVFSDTESQMELKGKNALYDSFSGLSAKRSLSLSLLRGGVPHKIYYYLN